MIREYKSDDLEVLWETYQDCFTLPTPFWQFRDACERGRTYILELLSRFNEETNLKGFVISFIDENEPWVWSLGVSPQHRKFGHGKSLLEKAETYYKNLKYEKINLFVETDNPAQKLYFDQGYRVRGVTEKTLRMIKEL